MIRLDEIEVEEVLVKDGKFSLGNGKRFIEGQKVSLNAMVINKQGKDLSKVLTELSSLDDMYEFDMSVTQTERGFIVSALFRNYKEEMMKDFLYNKLSKLNVEGVVVHTRTATMFGNYEITYYENNITSMNYNDLNVEDYALLAIDGYTGKCNDEIYNCKSLKQSMGDTAFEEMLNGVLSNTSGKNGVMFGIVETHEGDIMRIKPLIEIFKQTENKTLM